MAIDAIARPLPAQPTHGWLQWPASHLIFLFLSALILLYVGAIDRTFLIDQQNYVDNFINAASLRWIRALAEPQSLFEFVVVQFVSEEFLWKVWATLFGTIFAPIDAVLFTVYALNALIIASAWRTKGPSLAIALWILVPVGFAAVGLLQIRQGLAFAVLMYFSLNLRRPALGAAIAAMIHTTCAVAVVFALVGWVFRSRERAGLVAALTLAFAGAYFGGLLFEAFGGRRVMTYGVQEGATSINYVFGGMLCMLPSLYWLLKDWRVEDRDAVTVSTSQLALIHVGATAFTLFSYFIFPLGAGRVGYFTQLLLIPLLPAFRATARGLIPTGIFALLVLYLVYLVAKSYFDGVYNIYLGF